MAALPDPGGVDQGNGTVTLLNASAADVDLSGWRLTDAAGGRHDLTGVLAGGSVLQVVLGSGLLLGNRGDTVLFIDVADATIDRVTYRQDRVRAGRTICFGR